MYTLSLLSLFITTVVTSHTAMGLPGAIHDWKPRADGEDLFGNYRIHPINQSDLCLTVLGNNFGSAPPVQLVECFKDDTQYAPMQRWYLRPILERQTEIVLAFTANVSEIYDLTMDLRGGKRSITLMQVLNGWYLSGNSPSHMASRLGGRSTECLVVDEESKAIEVPPYGTTKEVKFIECAEGQEQIVSLVLVSNVPNRSSAPRPPREDPKVPNGMMTDGTASKQAWDFKTIGAST
ncbi:hypothetical protein IAT40_006008 [Kwoniella sp. CBS 6097]